MPTQCAASCAFYMENVDTPRNVSRLGKSVRISVSHGRDLIPSCLDGRALDNLRFRDRAS